MPSPTAAATILLFCCVMAVTAGSSGARTASAPTPPAAVPTPAAPASPIPAPPAPTVPGLPGDTMSAPVAPPADAAMPATAPQPTPRPSGGTAPSLATPAAASGTAKLSPQAGAPVAAVSAGDCPASPDLPVPRLPHTRAALATNQPILIVAIGSSSTRGWMATDIGHSYPALLQRYLNDNVSHISVAVINRGIGGQDAPEELARLETDVLAIRPQLVIWQAGANGAVRDESPATFKHLMQEGITQLKAAGADVMLMDNQRSPKILASADHVLLETAIREVAAASGVNMFSRGALMDGWAGAGVPTEDFIAADGMHMNNRGYTCLALALGRTIAAALKQPITQQAAVSK